MHLYANMKVGDEWAMGVHSTLSPSPPPSIPEFPYPSAPPYPTSSSYTASTSGRTASNRSLSNNGHALSTTLNDPDDTPRGSWSPQLDYRAVVSLSSSPCNTTASFDGLARPDSATPKGIPSFEDLTLADIEALEELPGASGRRQSVSYRFGSDRVIKVSPHQSIHYEVKVLSYIKQVFPSIPVPQVFGARQLVTENGAMRFCMLLEHIDGMGADEAAYEWGPEETRAFMDSVNGLRQILSAHTGRQIQAVDAYKGQEAIDGGCDMGGVENGQLSTSPSSKNDNAVQDELFDHIWQTMDRGPFASEAEFVASVSVALQRRGAGAARLDLVTRMMDQLAKACTAKACFPFQHANLTLGNFLVRRQHGGGGTPQIVGVLGWGQSGFYPAWWEPAKMAASEERLMVDMAAQDDAFPQYSQHASVMLHVRDIIY